MAEFYDGVQNEQHPGLVLFLTALVWTVEEGVFLKSL